MPEVIVQSIERHAFLIGLFVVVSLIGAKVDANVFTAQRARAAGDKSAAHWLREFQIVLWYAVVMVVCVIAPDPEKQGWTAYQSIGVYSIVWAASVASYSIVTFFGRRFNVALETFGDTRRPPAK